MGVSIDCCNHAWPNKEFIVIHNGFDEKSYKLCETDLRQDELVVTQIGTYSENKNQLFSIAVIKELKNMYPKAKLNIIGAEREKGYFSKIQIF